MESIGFKEWALICEALGSGDQSIILRKGGIAEGRQGFSFEHREFFLFPTWFHEQPQKIKRSGPEIPKPQEDSIEIRYFATLESSHLITSWETAEALEPFHLWQRDVVRERFQYDDAPGLHVAFVRVSRVVPVWTISNDDKFGGCRSWVTLPPPNANMQFEPVLSDEDHARVRDKLTAVIAQEMPA